MGAAVLCRFRAELGPRLIQCGLGRGLLPYQVASYPSTRLAAINIGQKLAGGGRALSSGGSWLGPHLSLTVEALYRAKCVKTRCFQEGVGHLEPRFQGEGVVPLTIY